MYYYSKYCRLGHGNTNQRGSSSELECPKACTMNIKLVCGSDGQTYSNKCELMANACRSAKLFLAYQTGLSAVFTSARKSHLTPRTLNPFDPIFILKMICKKNYH